MYPSSSNTNNSIYNNLFALTTHSMPGSCSVTVDKNCSAASSLEDPAPPAFWHFPAAPFIGDIDHDDDGLLMSHLLSQAHHQQILGSSSTNVAPPDSEINAAADSRTKDSKKVVTTKRKRSSAGNGGKQQGIPRKRTGKKDRHSKIYTAHGPRDRRMRLSLQIARKFFDLQDMLGFDKASKTIDWLFSKSKAAIKELTDNLSAAKGVNYHSCSGGGKSVSISTSESEVLSAAKECDVDNMGDQRPAGVTARAEFMRNKGTGRETITKERKARKLASFNAVARSESRDKARARARERTREKMKMRSGEVEKSKNCSDESSNPNNELERLQSSSSSPLENGENLGPSTTTHQPNSCLKVVAEELEEEPAPQPHQSSSSSTVQSLEQYYQMDSAVSIIEKFLGISSSARPVPTSSSMFNHSSLNSIAAGGSSGENSEENLVNFPGNLGMNNNDKIRYGYCTAMTNIKELSSTGNAQEQNPSSIIFMTDPNIAINTTQGENPTTTSNVMVSSYSKIVVNHNSDLIMTHEGRSPTSILMPTTSDNHIALHLPHYQQNPAVTSKYHNLY